MSRGNPDAAVSWLMDVAAAAAEGEEEAGDEEPPPMPASDGEEEGEGGGEEGGGAEGEAAGGESGLTSDRLGELAAATRLDGAPAVGPDGWWVPS